MASIISLLTTAIMLLQLVQTNPNLPQSFKDTATNIANSAISQATEALKTPGSVVSTQIVVPPVATVSSVPVVVGTVTPGTTNQNTNTSVVVEQTPEIKYSAVFSWIPASVSILTKEEINRKNAIQQQSANDLNSQFTHVGTISIDVSTTTKSFGWGTIPFYLTVSNGAKSSDIKYCSAFKDGTRLMSGSNILTPVEGYNQGFYDQNLIFNRIEIGNGTNFKLDLRCLFTNADVPVGATYTFTFKDNAQRGPFTIYSWGVTQKQFEVSVVEGGTNIIVQ